MLLPSFVDNNSISSSSIIVVVVVVVVIELLLQHVVCHVVCSTAIDTTAYTINALGNRVNLTRGPATTVTTTTDHDDDDDDDDNNLRFNTAVVTAADLMATDGVVHIVDELSIPTDGL